MTTRLARMQALLGENYTPADLRAAFDRDPDAVRAAGGTTWTVREIAGEFATAEDAERAIKDAIAVSGKRRWPGTYVPVEGPASPEAILGLHGMVV